MEVSSPLLSKALVGRETELNRIINLLELASSGVPQLAIISGEAGLGKTRLCRALSEHALSADMLLLSGQTLAQDSALPFGPLLDALRRYYSGQSRQFQPGVAVPGLNHFLRLLPELEPLFPGSLSLYQDAPGTMAQQQNRLFQLILNGLRELAAHSKKGLVLVLEDLHWADETSLDLLVFLARQLGVNGSAPLPAIGDKILIVGTFRTEALNDSPALVNLLRLLNQQRQVHEIKLAPLDRANHTRLLESILFSSLSRELDDLLYGWDEGNPFFTEELLSGLRTAGYLTHENGQWRSTPELAISLPLSLKSSILERLAILPQDEQQILSYAAVIGREFDFDLLLQLTGLDERQMISALRRAINLQLISEVTAVTDSPISNDRYQFRHALTREAIYSDMLTRERRSLHREIAEALEKQKNRAGSRVLAEHYLRAGLPDRARPFALKEAENARRVAAFREERYYLQIGLENLPEDDPERLSAEHRLGLLSLSLLDIPATFKWLSRAKDGFQRIGRARKAASVLVNLSFLYWFWSPSQLPGLLQELENFARVTLEEPEQDLEALHVYSQTAFSLTGNDNHRRALEWVKRSYEVAAGIDDPMKYGSLQFSALAQGVAQTDSSAAEAEMGLAAIRGVLEFALKYNLPEMALVSYGNLMPALVYLGRTVEAAQLRQELTDYENRTGTARMSNMKALSYFFEGNWAEIIEELGREKEQSISPTVKALHRVAYAGFLIERGDLALAQTELEAALPVTELHQYSYRAPTLWYCGRLYAAMHDSRKAHEYFDRFYELWKTSDDRGLVIPALLDGILFFVADNSLVKARRWLADLKEISIQTGSPVARAALWEAEAELARAEGAHRDAPEFLTKALQGWVELGWKYRQALVSERLARLKLQSSQSGKDTRLEADELLGFASEIYRILNIQPRLAGIDNLRQETRLDTQSKRRATLEASRAPHQGLTRREFQVLVHISAGMTNREIAESLSISVGTVELHVNRVLGKLGCDTRTQAAAYAVEKGWTKSELNL